MDNTILTKIMDLCLEDLEYLRVELEKLKTITESGISPDPLILTQIAHRQAILSATGKHISIYLDMDKIDWEKEKTNLDS